MGYFGNMNIDDLKKHHDELFKQLKEYEALGLDLNMTRGKPCREQEDLSNGLVDGSIDFSINNDYRNYGILDGIDELKEIYKDLLEVEKDELIIGGNSSLALMHDTLMRAMLLGTIDSEKPWIQEEKVKFLCPVPGYDRHFSITELLGIEMINIELNDDGPDMNQVEELVKNDPLIKGMWCVPKYSNPTGITYSDETVHRLANMETAARDFKIMWDNAYLVHHLGEEEDHLANILEECKAAGNPNRVYLFTSTSKITFPGGGIGMMAASVENAEYIKKQLSVQTIGFNKINQLMHARFLPSMDALREHMKKHAAIIAPKFEVVLKLLSRNLDGYNIAEWNEPKGGYFISMNVMDGCAKRVVELCKMSGVTLTPAGAVYPYGKDPKDSTIRIAPTFPPIEELEVAITILTIAVKVAAIEKIMEAKK